MHLPPIPSPDRLIPRRFSRTPAAGPRRSNSAAEGLLTLASFPIVLGSPLVAGALGAAISGWLAIPAGFIGLGLALAIVESTTGCGVLVGLVYSGIAFLAMDGTDLADPTPAWIGASLVFVGCLWLTYSASKGTRS